MARRNEDPPSLTLGLAPPGSTPPPRAPAPQPPPPLLPVPPIPQPPPPLREDTPPPLRLQLGPPPVSPPRSVVPPPPPPPPPRQQPRKFKLPAFIQHNLNVQPQLPPPRQPSLVTSQASPPPRPLLEAPAPSLVPSQASAPPRPFLEAPVPVVVGRREKPRGVIAQRSRSLSATPSRGRGRQLARAEPSSRQIRASAPPAGDRAKKLSEELNFAFSCKYRAGACRSLSCFMWPAGQDPEEEQHDLDWRWQYAGSTYKREHMAQLHSVTFTGLYIVRPVDQSWMTLELTEGCGLTKVDPEQDYFDGLAPDRQEKLRKKASLIIFILLAWETTGNFLFPLGFLNEIVPGTVETPSLLASVPQMEMETIEHPGLVRSPTRTVRYTIDVYEDEKGGFYIAAVGHVGCVRDRADT